MSEHRGTDGMGWEYRLTVEDSGRRILYARPEGSRLWRLRVKLEPVGVPIPMWELPRFTGVENPVDGYRGAT